MKLLLPGLIVVGVAALGGSGHGATATPLDVTSPAAPLADGKYENVVVEGRVVPMIHVKNDRDVVLVDTDGKKPRLWEEQYKRKGNAPKGTYNVHKSNRSGTDSFENEPIDREGIWTIDSAGNITAQ